jgi:hypothetical protein
MSNHTTTQPVILIGPELQEASGFNRVILKRVDSDGLISIETHLQGKVFVQMVGEELHISAVSTKKESPST